MKQKVTHAANTPKASAVKATWVDALVAAVLILVPFHAFLTVWASQLVGHFTLLRLWDEAALAVVAAYACVYLWRNTALRAPFLESRLVRLVGLYVLLVLLLGVVALVKHEVSLKALGYALIIDLRFLLWLLAVWVVCSRSAWLSWRWRRLVFVPLAIVVAFGLLQFFVLPHSFLKHFGYNSSVSYVAEVTLNQDSSTLRIQSFLRGVNQLGAYLVAMLGLLLAGLHWRKVNWKWWALSTGSLLALFLTFSRSAWLGAAVTGLTAVWWRAGRYRKGLAIGVTVGCAAVALVLWALWANGGVRNALLHVNSGHSTAAVTSNQGHESALHSSLRDLVAQPFGGGPGTAGQASVYNNGHAARNTESYWLQLGLEFGWPGLLVFAAILLVVASELWSLKTNPLTLGLLAALAGLLVVNFFAYGFADDTLAFTWWGLAGLALASPEITTASAAIKNHKNHETATKL